jgi:hypothetical protein
MTEARIRQPRVLSEGERVSAVNLLWHAARAMKEAMIRHDHPDWDNAQVAAAVRKVMLLGG